MSGSKLTLCALACVSLFAVGCVSPYDPFQIEPAEFRNRFGYVAVLPIDVRVDLEPAGEPVREIERAITAKLKGAGLRVLDVAAGRAIRDRIIQEIGGLEPAEDGKVDPEKRRLVDDYTARELLAEHPVDALLRLYLVPVRAEFSGAYAHWDGTSQRVQSIMGELLSILTVQASGYLGALSLLVAVEGRNGQPLYIHRGGIEVLFQRQGLTGFKKVPEQMLLQQPTRVDGAIDYTLSPALRAP